MNIPVTEWFPAEVKPSVVGEYEYQYESGYTFRAFWDGACFAIRDLHDLYWWDRIISVDGYWRGLTSPHPEWKP